MISSRLVLTIAIFGSAAKTTMAVDPIKCNSPILLVNKEFGPVVSGCDATATALNDAIEDKNVDEISCSSQGGLLVDGGNCDATATALNDANDKNVDEISCTDNGFLKVDGGNCSATACALNDLIDASDAACAPPWQAAMNGCCREHVPGRKRGNPPVISQETIDGGTMADAIDKCKQLCNDESTCTAVEVRPIKKTRWNKINKKNKKKTSKGFACELHRSINASSRKSKSCKKAKCFTMDQSD